jgi:hypothetical protein
MTDNQPAFDLLPAALLELAQDYRRMLRWHGEALLTAAQGVAEARAQVPRGDWYTFLATIALSIATAERLLQLHRLAHANPRFAALVRANWLAPTVAMLLARPSTPPDVVDAVLDAPDPPTAAALLRHIRAAHSTAPPTAPPAPVATGEELALSLSKGGRGDEGHPNTLPAPDPPSPTPAPSQLSAISYRLSATPDPQYPLTDQIPHAAGDPTPDPSAPPDRVSAAQDIDRSTPDSQSKIKNQKSKIPRYTPAWEAALDPTEQAILAELRRQYTAPRAIGHAFRTALWEIAVTVDELGKQGRRIPRQPTTKHLLRAARRAVEALHDYVLTGEKKRIEYPEHVGHTYTVRKWRPPNKYRRPGPPPDAAPDAAPA